MSEKKHDTSKPVDELITAVPGNWKFNEQVTAQFDSHVRKSVPLYDEIQNMVVEISEWFIRDNSIVYDLGSSTGETISLLINKHAGKKNVRYIGVEESISMIEAARRKCSMDNVQYLHQNLDEITEFLNIDYIMSLYTLQFLPLRKRIKVIKRIYNGLNEGGAFVLVEKIRAENSLFEDLWLDLYWDFKQNQGLNSDQVIHKSQSLRGVLIPLTLSENIKILRGIGFDCIDTFVKWHNFVGMIAVKMPSDAGILKKNEDIDSDDFNEM